MRSYKARLGWTQQRIAEAKGVSQQLVSERLRLHGLPQHIKDFTTQGLLTETHLREISTLQLELYFSPWLTTEQAWEEIADRAPSPLGRVVNAAGTAPGG